MHESAIAELKTWKEKRKTEIADRKKKNRLVSKINAYTFICLFVERLNTNCKKRPKQEPNRRIAGQRWLHLWTPLV